MAVQTVSTMTFLTLLTLQLLGLLSSCPFVWSLQLNVHLPLTRVNNSWAFDKCPYNAALESNLALRRASDTEQINFFSVHTPHVTLFLSDFNVTEEEEHDSVILDQIVSAIQEVVSNRSQMWCEVHWDDTTTTKSTTSMHMHNPTIAGPYTMYAVPKTPCLSQLSDDIVRAMSPFLQRPQEIPVWVYHLPLLQRWRKIYLIRNFGSPNVFDDYEPHVTVGYDEMASVTSRKEALLVSPVEQQQSQSQSQQQSEQQRLSCRAWITHVVISKVGVGGSVLQDGLIGSIRLEDPARMQA